MILGVIIAGGASTRLGQNKPFAPFRGSTLIEHVIARVRPQVAALALNLRPEDTHRLGTAYTILTEPNPGNGPIPGILAGLEWLATHSAATHLATFPCDTPFLPPNLVAQLPARKVPAYAVSETQPHYLCALWPRESAAALRAAFGTSKSVHRCLESLQAIPARIDSAPTDFLNINTQADLERDDFRLNCFSGVIPL